MGRSSAQPAGTSARFTRHRTPPKLLFCDEKDRLLEEYGIFVGTADQADSLQDGAVVARESSGFGGVRCLVKRDLVPQSWPLERPTVEDVVLFLVKGAKKQ